MLNKYQDSVSKNKKNHCNKDNALIDWALGIAGESGEIVDIIKKTIFQGHRLSVEDIIEEVGDLMWYITALCSTLDISLEKVLDANMDKLSKRYPNGFTQIDSIQRVDVNTDMVDQPVHYTSNGVMEVIDILQDQLTEEEFKGFLRGNILKYQLRYRNKNGLEDLHKQQWYTNRLIEMEK